jgi:hypothetical protein
MSPQNQWRLDLAKRIAPIYTEHPNVQVIVVGGSVSYGLADCYSDVEIGLFWSQTPSIETRKAFANRIGIAKDFEPWNKHGDNGADEAIYIWGDQKTGFNSTSNTAYPQQKSKASPTPQKDHGNFGNTPSPSTAMNWPNNGAKKPSPHTSNHPSRNSKPPQQSLSLLDLRTSGSRR